MPVRSRRSTNSRPPRFRWRATHPLSSTRCPASAAVSVPASCRFMTAPPRWAASSPRGTSSWTPAGEIAHRDDAAGDLLLADQQDVRDAELVGALQVALERAPGEVPLAAQAGGAQLLADGDHLAHGHLADADHAAAGAPARPGGGSSRAARRSAGPRRWRSRSPAPAGRRSRRSARRSGRRRAPRPARRGRRRRSRTPCACSSRGRAPAGSPPGAPRRSARAAPRTVAKCSRAAGVR